jgi:hypothetical protein
MGYALVVADEPKTRGRPFKPGESGNPTGRAKGSKNRPKTLELSALITVAELARLGRTPRQIARLLKAKPAAVDEAVRQGRRVLEVCAPQFAEHWLIASRVAAAAGDHRPAMAAMQSTKAIEPIAQTYSTNGPQAVAAVKVEFHGFTFAGLPAPTTPPAAPAAIDVTPTRR